jgi:ubiquinone/menaquinone biosynthesis C-methylase UbiE
MGLYSKVVFPFLLDKAMKAPQFAEHRRKILAQARGRILEIGFGTGTNLEFYPASVNELTALEPNEGMERYSKAKALRSAIKVNFVRGTATAMPFADGAFNTVVSTLVLCSVADISKALTEIRRVLKTDGQFLFVEHGLHPSPRVAKLQQILNPLNKKLADGCHINRDMTALIKAAGFDETHIENAVLRKAPPTHGYIYEGCAISKRYAQP